MKNDLLTEINDISKTNRELSRDEISTILKRVEDYFNDDSNISKEKLAHVIIDLIMSNKIAIEILSEVSPCINNFYSSFLIIHYISFEFENRIDSGVTLENELKELLLQYKSFLENEDNQYFIHIYPSKITNLNKRIINYLNKKTILGPTHRENIEDDSIFELINSITNDVSRKLS